MKEESLPRKIRFKGDKNTKTMIDAQDYLLT
jgi:hypothetical protein